MLKSTFLSLSLLLAVGCSAAEEDEYGEDLPGERTSDIVGGSNASIANHPWQVSVQSSGGSHFCGGSIIGAQWILTAQHCVDDTGAIFTSPATVRVAAGASQLSAMSSSGQIRSVDEIIPYPGYVDPSSGEDVALLHLSTPLTLGGNVQAIALATPTDQANGLTNPGVTATVSGWGALSSGGSSPNTLQAVNVPIVSNAAADAAYPESITADQLAAGDMNNGGEDACQGDSGGPLTVAKGSGRILAGVVSWGYGCASAQYPGMYARVASFQSWISGVVASSPVVLASHTGQSASSGTWKHFAVTVPAGTPMLNVHMSGGSGDGDLYVRAGSQPTSSSYHCRPYEGGNNESCNFSNPTAGTWYVSIYAYSGYSGVTVKATTYGTGGPPPAEVCDDGTDNDGDGQADCDDADCSADAACEPSGSEPVTVSASNLSVSKNQWADFTPFTVSPGSPFTAVMTRLGGNPDLYVRWSALPTTSTYHCRPYLSGNETCNLTVPSGVTQAYVSVRGRNNGSNTFNLSVTYTP